MGIVVQAAAAAEERELELERLAIAGFVEVLRREQLALAENEVDALEALAVDKLRWIDSLTRFADQRNARLRAAGHSADFAGMNAWLQQHAAYPAVGSAWARVAALAREARDQNEVNGLLLAMQMQRTQRQLAFLSKAASNEPVYSADGVSRSSLSKRSLGEA